VTAPTGVPGALRRAKPADRDLLIQWMHAFDVESFGPEAGRRDVAALADELVASGHRKGWVWDDGGPVSTASTTGQTPNGIRVGAVYTPPEHRGQGYATACVAAVSQAELDVGRRWCFLFTDLANPISNRIYRRIGYEPVRDVDIYRFDGAPAP
jgi:predicted GNAT family acetyltransferase